MTIFHSLIKKEILHIVRDRRTMVITLVMPLVLLLLFGFAVSTEVDNVRVVAVVDRHTDLTCDIIERMSVNEYFSFEGLVAQNDIDPLMRKGEIEAALLLRDDESGQLTAQIIVDAANPTIGRSSSVYIRGILSATGAKTRLLTRTLYNPEMKSAYNFVPGILGMIFILICAIMTSVSIVSEKESGSMSLLLVSPAKPQTVIFGKLVPYFLLSCIILSAMLTMAYTVLGLPLSSTVWWVVVLSVIYIVMSLSVGLMVSTMVDTQLSALVVSAVMFMLPVIMLSGMIFPLANMPEVLQWLSCIIPARWYVAAMRKLMIQQLDVGYVMEELAILGGMTLLFLSVAIKKFKSSN